MTYFKKEHCFMPQFEQLFLTHFFLISFFISCPSFSYLAFSNCTVHKHLRSSRLLPPPHTEKTYYDASRYIHQSLVYTVKNKKIKNDIILCLKIKLKLQISLFDLNTLFKPVIYCGNFTKI